MNKRLMLTSVVIGSLLGIGLSQTRQKQKSNKKRKNKAQKKARRVNR